MVPVLAGGFAFALDQLAKEVAVRRGAQALVLNAGSRISTRHGVGSLLALWSLLVLAFALLVGRPPLAGELLALAGLGAALGGAAGNLVDRFRRGGVVDFISVGRWPAFNLADAAIVTGVVIALGALA
jgi:lipoprotein signal peptidase